MKAKIKTTGKEVNVLSIRIMGDDDYYDYHPWEVDIIPENTTNWEEVRIKAAIAAMQALLCMPDLAKIVIKKPIDEDIEPYVAKAAVGYADALIKELKGE